MSSSCHEQASSSIGDVVRVQHGSHVGLHLLSTDRIIRIAALWIEVPADALVLTRIETLLDDAVWMGRDRFLSSGPDITHAWRDRSKWSGATLIEPAGPLRDLILRRWHVVDGLDEIGLDEMPPATSIVGWMVALAALALSDQPPDRTDHIARTDAAPGPSSP